MVRGDCITPQTAQAHCKITGELTLADSSTVFSAKLLNIRVCIGSIAAAPLSLVFVSPEEECNLFNRANQS